MGFTGDAGGADGASGGDGRWIQFRLDSLWRTRNGACGWNDAASRGDNSARDSRLTLEGPELRGGPADGPPGLTTILPESQIKELSHPRSRSGAAASAHARWPFQGRGRTTELRSKSAAEDLFVEWRWPETGSNRRRDGPFQGRGRTTELRSKSAAGDLFVECGGQRRDRTADAGLFRAALYH